MSDDKKGGGSGRNYKVLKAVEGAKNDYDIVAEVDASSAEQAIRNVAGEHGEGVYVAVPERSWSEITVKIEVPAPRIILSEGTSDVSTAAATLDVTPEPDSRKAPEAEPAKPQQTSNLETQSRAEQRRAATDA